MKKQKKENKKAVTSCKEQTACTNATTTELSDPSDSSKRKKSNTKTYWILFYTFLKIGAFTFGGGYAMIPLIQKEIVEKRRWISSDTVLEIIAIAESTPGPIAVNTATFVDTASAVFGEHCLPRWASYSRPFLSSWPSLMYCRSFPISKPSNMHFSAFVPAFWH